MIFDADKHTIPMAVRFTGGKQNGHQGNLVKVSETFGEVIITVENKKFSVIEELQFMTPLAEYVAGQSETERNLKGNPFFA